MDWFLYDKKLRYETVRGKCIVNNKNLKNNKKISENGISRFSLQINIFAYKEAATRGVLLKKASLKISRNSQ